MPIPFAGPIAAAMLTQGASTGLNMLAERHRAQQQQGKDALQAAIAGLGGRGVGGGAGAAGGGLAGFGAQIAQDPFVRAQMQRFLQDLMGGGQQRQQQGILQANSLINPQSAGLEKILPALKQLGGIR